MTANTASGFTRRQFLVLACIAAGVYAVAPPNSAYDDKTNGSGKIGTPPSHSRISAIVGESITEALKRYLASRLVAHAEESPD